MRNCGFRSCFLYAPNSYAEGGKKRTIETGNYRACRAVKEIGETEHSTKKQENRNQPNMQIHYASDSTRVESTKSSTMRGSKAFGTRRTKKRGAQKGAQQKRVYIYIYSILCKFQLRPNHSGPCLADCLHCAQFPASFSANGRAYDGHGALKDGDHVEFLG